MAKITKAEELTLIYDGKIFAKTVQLGLGVDLLGSTLSLSKTRHGDLEITPVGIKAIGKKSGRVVLIPWSNIKAVELFE